MATRAHALKLFGRSVPLHGKLSGHVEVFGLRIPLMGIVIVVALTLVAVAILAIVFSRGPKHLTQTIHHEYAVEDAAFLRSMGVLLGPQLLPGNKVDTLINGDQIFPSMLQAIRSAKKTIVFESYIYWSGKIGKEFADALSERSRNGVKVHVLVDWVGSHRMDQAYVDEMGRAGVEIMRYHKPHWFEIRHLNNRTHRKVLVADGRVGFTGGVGIADEWSGNAQDPDHWRDTHYRIEGPAVAHLAATFADNWSKVSGTVLHGDDYFPALRQTGSMLAQMFKSSSEGGAESMHLMYLLSIAAATKTIDLSMAYFIPDQMALDHLVDALKRGVRVRVIMPGEHTDAAAVRAASRAGWGPILRAGAELYEYQPTMFHCKVLVVDGIFVSVGSTNFDSRSFRLNDEANLNVHDRAFAAVQTRQFEEDLKRSRRITLREWEDRPFSEKLWGSTLQIFNPQL